MELKCGAVIPGRRQGIAVWRQARRSFLIWGKLLRSDQGKEFDRLGDGLLFSPRGLSAAGGARLKVIPDLPVEGREGPISPMGGILSCFEQTRCDLLFFVSCDMPLFHRRMAARLLELWTPGTDALVWRTRSGRPAALRAVRPLLPAGVERMRGAERLPPDAFFWEKFHAFRWRPLRNRFRTSGSAT